jgi:ferric-dicitrate binding protein FerR (iron transport regulator)
MRPGITEAQIREYAEKWMKGTITEEEKNLLDAWYHTAAEEELRYTTLETEDELRDRLFNAILEERVLAAIVTPTRKKTITINFGWWKLAAGVILISLVSWAWLHGNKRQEPAIAQQAIIKRVRPATDQPASFIRHISLPDGSQVVLQANSQLNFPEQFLGSSREVTLSGEAYFDIEHDPQRPFIIHTGQVKTTVLGTAFNISAYPDSRKVMVTVTRGKVKVEDSRKLLAVLTPNQKIIYENKTALIKKDTVDAVAQVANWTRQDMIFEGVRFDKAAEMLGRRYGVEIKFSNEALKNCTIKAYFNGTEELDKVLEVLCIISNASYSRPDKNTILLDGIGCED